MKEIGRRAWDLLRANRVLWLPVLVADLVGLAANQCMLIVDRAIYGWMTTGSSSVLGGRPDVPPMLNARMTEIAILTVPVVWNTYFVRAMAYAAALVATGVLVWGLDRGAPVDARVVWGAVRARLGRCAGFAGALTGLAFLWTILMEVLVWFLWKMGGRVAMLAVPYGSAFAGTVLVAWFLAPRALRLTRADGAAEVNDRQKRLARAYTMLGALASAMVFMAGVRSWNAMAIASPFLRGVPRGLVNTTLSLVSAIPYGVLFVALAVIGVGPRDEGDAEIVALSGDGDAVASLPEEREHLGDNGA